MPELTIGLIAVSATMLTLLLMPVAVWMAHAIHAIDQPDARKVHRQAMPRTGGLAMALAFGLTAWAFVPLQQEFLAFLVGMVVIVLTGLADDVWHIRPWMKFVGETLAALLFITLSHAMLHDFGNLLGSGTLSLGSLAIPVTVFCMVGVMNALNLSDGLDGLAGGISVIVLLFLGLFAVVYHQWLSLAIAAGLFGCLLGFLCFNTHPARVFMGDTGSLLLGYALSAIVVLLVQRGDGARVAPISMALILALPIVDTLLVMARRIYYGFSPFLPDKTHLHHRLLNLDLPHSAVVPVLYGSITLFGLLAVVMRSLPEWLQFLAGILLAAGIYGSVICGQHSGWKWHSRRVRWLQRAYRNRLYRQMAAWAGKSVPIVTWLLPLAFAVPLLAMLSLPHSVALAGLLVCAMSALMFPWRASLDRLGLSHGVAYVTIFALLGIYQFYGQGWITRYVAAVTMVLALWVMLKLVFKRHLRIFLTSGFELLMIIISWFVPLFLNHAINISPTMQQASLVVCLEAIPVLLALKIIIRKQPRRNRLLAASLIGMLLLVSLPGVLYGIGH
ncbi:MAG: MraY family glycosyltransferase [Mariprofundaceae bacterium]|nr:MraY family glycosyltransferase [Mariprofundaceae bacterium]